MLAGKTIFPCSTPVTPEQRPKKQNVILNNAEKSLSSRVGAVVAIGKVSPIGVGVGIPHVYLPYERAVCNWAWPRAAFANVEWKGDENEGAVIEDRTARDGAVARVGSNVD